MKIKVEDVQENDVIMDSDGSVYAVFSVTEYVDTILFIPRFTLDTNLPDVAYNKGDEVELLKR